MAHTKRRPGFKAILARIKARRREAARAHAEADQKCGRPWSCACGHCRIEREEPRHG